MTMANGTINPNDYPFSLFNLNKLYFVHSIIKLFRIVARTSPNTKVAYLPLAVHESVRYISSMAMSPSGPSARTPSMTYCK